MKAAALDVHFDSNVDKDLCFLRCGVTPEKADELKSYIAGGRLAIRLSPDNLEEASLRLETCPKESEAELGLMYALTGFNRLLKEVPDLLTEAICAYSEGKPSPSPDETDRKFLNHLQAFPSRFAAGPARWASGSQAAFPIPVSMSKTWTDFWRPCGKRGKQKLRCRIG